MFLLLSLIAFVFAGHRLIEFAPNQQQWLTDEEVAFLMDKPHRNFMDITDHANLSSTDLKVKMPFAFPTKLAHQAEVNHLKSRVSGASLKDFNDMLTRYTTRAYRTATGVEAAEQIHAEFLRMRHNHQVTVEFFHHTFPQPSVIARIPGTGPNKDEIVILGGHEDSTSSGARAPGADDDGSGTCTVLEVFRVLSAAGFQPDRTVEFHTYAAEEAGLLGSQAVASQYQKEGKKVYAMLQLDMTMYAGKDGKNLFGIVTDYVNPELTAFLRLLVDGYSNIKWVDTKCGYGCSDHASWTKAGYASAFPFEGPFSASNPYIHTVNDVFSHLSIEHGLNFAYVALGFLVELAGAH